MRKKKARRLKPFVSAMVTWFWRLAALSLLVAGLFCSLLQTYNFWHCLRARRWVSRTCTILKVEVEQTPESVARSHEELNVTYQWEWRGREITGYWFVPYARRIDPRWLLSGTVEELKSAVGRAGGSQCFVNPDQPFEAAISRDSNSRDILSYTLIQVLFIVGGCRGLNLWLLRSPQQKFETAALRTHPNDPHLWRTDWSNGFIGEEYAFYLPGWRLAGIYSILTAATSAAGLLLTDHWDMRRIGTLVFLGATLLALVGWMLWGCLRLRKWGKLTFAPDSIPDPAVKMRTLKG